MTTISELLLLVGQKLGEQPDGIKKNQSIKALSRLRTTLDNWEELVIDLPVEQTKELAEPTPEFFNELKKPSADEEDGVSARNTRAKKKTSSS